MMSPDHIRHVMMLVACSSLVVEASTTNTCYNSTIHATSDASDVTVFRGAETVVCEEGFGCSKTLISKAGKTIGVSRGCGLYGCLGKSCFLLHGHRLCVYCCIHANCNSAGAVTSELAVLGLSFVASWAIRKH